MARETFIHPTAVIGNKVTIGEGCYIGPFCIIGYPAEHRKLWGTESEYGVIIGDNVIMTGHCTVDAGTAYETIIGHNVMMMKGSHVGHDAIIHQNVTIACGAKIGGHCVIFHDSNIGLNAVIHQKVAIQYGCMIGMGAVVTKKAEMKPYRKYAGNPARDIGENVIPK